MNNDRLKYGVTGATLALVAGLGGAALLERLGIISIDLNKNSTDNNPIPTGSPTPDAFTATATETQTATQTLTPTETPTATLTPLPTMTETPVVYEDPMIMGSEFQSDFPAWINEAGHELTGITFSTVEDIKKYWLTRSLMVETGNRNIQRLDRMFGQLNLDVQDLTDRNLNFDWRNGGQGLGFDVFDFSVLRTVEDLHKVQNATGENVSPITREGEDGRLRVWTLATGRNFEEVVLAYVDEYIRLHGVANPQTNELVQSQRRLLFEDIIFNQLGVKELDRDALWQTINDEFAVCETFTSPADTRINQPENTRGVTFLAQQEKENNGIEEETITLHDSDNTLLVVAVIDGDTFRVEVFDLTNSTDPMNPDLDASEGNPARVQGNRWLKCGPGSNTPTHEQATPTRTYPTPVPTNPHRDEEHPEQTDVPDRVPPTQIP